MKRIILFIGLFIALANLTGQEFSGSAANSIVAGSTHLKIDEESKLIEYIEFNTNILKSTANDHLSTLTQALNLGEKYKLKEVATNQDSKGEIHIKNQLYYNNIPVEGMYFLSHFSSGILKSANGKIVNQDYGQVRNYINESNAIEKAIASTPSKEYLWTKNKTLYPSAELVYLPVNNQLYLCYKVDVYSLAPLSREYVYISAENEQVIKRISRIHNTDAIGTAQTQYSGNVNITADYDGNSYTLDETSRGLGISTFNLNYGTSYSSATAFTDGDNVWDVVTDRPAYDAHYGSEKTYDYFLAKFNRNSIDDNGYVINSYVHYSYNYANAFWDGQRMTYGDGDGVEYYPFTSLEIVGHEITHGLTSFTADLVYEYESGALNESFSDIFGTAIDFYANPGTANYLMGEQNNVNGIPFRSMENPNDYSLPDTYQGNYWYTGSYDNGGVHYNSSVQNYWFYLLCEGGDGTNDLGQQYIVHSIGMEAAEAIAYRTLTVYLTPYSGYYSARYYSILAATDLYGACSNEVIEVTNAWHAVGVGNVFDGAIRAGFTASQIYSCQAPVSITFENNSYQATNYEWYIDDTLFSTEENPSYEFTTEGTYTISLTATGNGACVGKDSLAQEDYILVTNDGGPVSPAATPGTLYPGSRGILYFSLAEMYNSSEGSIMGYEDFSCSKRAILTEGSTYSIYTYTATYEDVYVWLDLNGDGAFVDANELIYKSTNNVSHFGSVTIPRGSIYDSPIRLRVGSELAGYSTLTNGETTSRYGQYEDYTVFLSANTNAPIADFTVTPSVGLPGEIITFSDNSMNLPDEYSWTFEGGNPATSVEQNPQLIFSEDGIKTISLAVTNSYGTDTITKTYSVVNSINMGSQNNTNLPSGKLYDSGGPNGNYSNSENYTFLIQPDCAKSIQLSIESFSTESCCDYLNIYDGNSASATLIAELRGNITLPQVFNTTNGEVFLSFRSDGSVTSSGFEITWISNEYGDGNPVIADFAQPESNIPLLFEYLFEDQSQNEPYQWIWNFGDGSISGEQNPVHSYLQPGDFDVTLIAENCTSSDTITKTITVDAAPVLSVSTDTIRIEMISGETLDDAIPLSNGNGGILMFNGEVQASYKKDEFSSTTPELYSATVYTLSDDESFDITGINNIQIPLTDTYKGLNVAFSGFDLSNYSYVNAELIASGARTMLLNSNNYATALDTIDVLVIDDASDWLYMYANEIQKWISDGGLLIGNGDEAQYFYESIFLGTGITVLNDNCNYGSATITDHPVTKGITNYSIGTSALASIYTENEATPLLIDYSNNVYAAATTYNNGKILFVCDEAFIGTKFSYEPNAILFENALKWYLSMSHTWITVNNNWVALESNSDGGLDYSINTENMVEGIYIADVKLNTNDPDNIATLIPLRLDLTGIENIETVSDVYFPKTFVDYTDSLLITIRNTGTRNLEVTDIQTSNSDFITSFNTTTLIEPGNNIQVKINFSPTIAQYYTETLTIFSSDPDQAELSIPLLGNAVNPPVVSLPASIVENLFSYEISDQELIISNTGQSSLSIDSIKIEHFNSITGLVADTNHVELLGHTILCYEGSSASNFVSTLLSYGATAQYSTYLDTTSLDADVLYYSGNYSLNTNRADFLRRWVKAGHGLFIDVMYNYGQFDALLEGTGISISQNSYAGGLTTDISDHPITYGITQYYTDYGNSIIAEDEDDAIIKDSYGNVMVAAKEFGSGRIVITNMNGQIYPSKPLTAFGINVVRWLANKNSWLWVKNYPTDSIGPNQSHAMAVRFDAAGLLEGQYDAEIRMATNDPVNPVKTVEAQLNVTGIASVQFLTDTLYFGNVFTGTEKTISTSVFNAGTKDLEISNIFTDHEYFTVDDTIYTIPPREYRTVNVKYAPLATGNYDACLILQSNTTSEYDTLQIRGYGYNPPVINISPDTIKIKKRYEDVFSTETITIDNLLGGYTLDYDVAVRYKDNIYSSNVELETIKDSLINNGYAISNIIPNRFDFSGGTSSYYISDGGSDMYDGGNYLNTNYANRIYYSNNTIQTSAAFGIGGKYFTTKLNGLFILVADMNNVSEFYTTGSLGADGNGVAEGEIITVKKGVKTFKGFIKRVYNSGDPSVNHLIIIENDENVSHTFNTNTNYDEDKVSNLQNVKRIHYLLFAGTSSSYISKQSFETIMDTYLNVINSQSGWIAIDHENGSVDPGKSNTLLANIEPYELGEGHYEAEVVVRSNDPVNPEVSTVVQLHIFNNLPPYLTNPIGNKIIYSTYNDVIDLNNVFVDADGDQLYYTVTSSDNSIVFPVLNNGHELQLSPISNGVANIEIKCTDNNWDPIYDNFDVLVQQNNRPIAISALQNIELNPASPDVTLLLSSYFSDPDGDNLTYRISMSKQNIVTYDAGGDIAIFNAETNGATIITVTADDGRNGTVSQSFIITVKDISTSIGNYSLNQFRLIPNPVEDQFIIELDKPRQIENISLITSDGTEMNIEYTSNELEVEMNASALKPGIYLVKMTFDDECAFVRMIKK
nr:M4 family metallopeptidase [uncultured Carboxylicivirga sp.]